MKFKTLMIIKAIVCIVFGPILLFFPGPFIALLGLNLVPSTALMANLYGATVLGNFMPTWFARKAEPSPVRRAIIMHLFVYSLVALIVSLLFKFSGDLKNLGWFVVFIYFFFTIGYGYFLFMKKSA